MRIAAFPILLLSLATSVFSQKVGSETHSLSECAGAINIFENRNFQIQFSGKSNVKRQLEAYPSLEKFDSDNYIWLSYTASENGLLTFSASVENQYLQMVIFQQEQNDICEDITMGIAEILRLQSSKTYKTVGLDSAIGGGVMYTLNMRKGQKIQILLATAEEEKGIVSLDWNFISANKQVAESRTIDHRYDDFAPTFKIIVRDKETREPLIGNISIEGNRKLNGLYNGSEILFNVDRNCVIIIQCDVEGYFFTDREEQLSAFEDEKLVIEMERVEKGKSIQIEDIEFMPGTSEIMKSSEPKLRRLRDFLLLNAELEVEIQGHVHNLGENILFGQRISEERAKRVRDYLIENGIDRRRLSYIGYGNTRPIYPEARLSYEEQANRRVEIMIK